MKLVVDEVPYEERISAELLTFFFDKQVAAGDIVEVNSKGYSDLLLYLKVSDACTIILDAVSPVGSEYDAEYNIDSFIPIVEVVKSFSSAGSDIIDLNDVISTKKALKANFLRFKFTATVTASFALVGKSTTSTAPILAQQYDIIDRIVHRMYSVPSGSEHVWKRFVLEQRAEVHVWGCLRFKEIINNGGRIVLHDGGIISMYR